MTVEAVAATEMGTKSSGIKWFVHIVHVVAKGGGILAVYGVGFFSYSRMFLYDVLLKKHKLTNLRINNHNK